MEHKTWATMDKTAWPEGPWKNEPDKEQWEDEATGMPCLLVRNRRGALCGYVGVDASHPLHGKGYDGCIDGMFSVHGGLTYSDFCMEGPEAENICHVPSPGEPDPIWWFGFDCALYGDFEPGDGIYDGKRFFEPVGGGEYRTVAYVKSECADLARQLAAAFVTRYGGQRYDGRTGAV